MTRLAWHEAGQKLYEDGVDRVVLYTDNEAVAWNGATSIQEIASGLTSEPFYHDGVKYIDLLSNEDFQAVLESFYAPPQFAPFEGAKNLAPGFVATGQPRRKTFGLSYRSLIGNDLEADDHGYKIHLVYNATAVSDQVTRQTKSNSITISPNRWTIDTVPVRPIAPLVFKPTAHFVIDSTKVSLSGLLAVEELLYGTSTTDAELPSPYEVTQALATVGGLITEPLGEPL